MNSFDPDYIIFKLPLYKTIIIEDEIADDFIRLMNFGGQIEEYSIKLKENTSYKVEIKPSDNSLNPNTGILESYLGMVSFKLKCVRTQEYTWSFFKVTTNGKIRPDVIFQVEKIGQTPSIADIQIGKIKDYSKVLDKEKLNEFSKAIGLISHGIGIGSFVYLRRIFEFLIQEAYEKSKTESGWDDNKYHSARMNEKIELLKNNLPDFLVENRKLYGILSTGIHSLTEDECLEYFDAVKIGIELILDEKLDKYNTQKKIEEASKKLQIMSEKLK